jgi:hypothetical protein
MNFTNRNLTLLIAASRRNLPTFRIPDYDLQVVDYRGTALEGKRH